MRGASHFAIFSIFKGFPYTLSLHTEQSNNHALIAREEKWLFTHFTEAAAAASFSRSAPQSLLGFTRITIISSFLLFFLFRRYMFYRGSSVEPSKRWCHRDSGAATTLKLKLGQSEDTSIEMHFTSHVCCCHTGNGSNWCCSLYLPKRTWCVLAVATTTACFRGPGCNQFTELYTVSMSLLSFVVKICRGIIWRGEKKSKQEQWVKMITKPLTQ